MKKLLIIDGNSILNRAYYGIRPLTAPDGTPTNAVYGFLNILFKYLEEENPDYLTVAFDVKEKTFRHKRYELYKAQRKPAPEDFLVQLPLIKDVLSAMNINCMELPGYEADDIIGTVSRICDEEKVACRILTGDKDDLQLASDNTVIKLVITRMGKTSTTDYGKEQFIEKYGFSPSSFIDLKALMGDSSDNIPGVAGIGEKTAMALITEHLSIDEIYKDISAVKATDGVKKKLADGKENAYLSFELATIDRFTPIEFDFKNTEIKEYDKEKLAQLFTRLNFTSFIKKLGLSEAVASSSKKGQIEGKGKNVTFSELFNICKKSGKASYISKDGTLYAKPYASDTAYIATAGKEDLKEFFKCSAIEKIGFDIKSDMLKVSELGLNAPDIEFNSVIFDAMLAAYIINPSGSDYNIDDLCLKYLSAVLKHSEAKDDDMQISMSIIPSANSSEESAVQTDRVFALELLYDKLSGMIKENNQENLYYNVELPLTEVLADMQIRGMYIDKSELENFGKILETHINTLTKEIYDLAGEEFNINSPKQLGVILFEKLGLPFGKKNKSGGYSTNVDILEKLKDKHKIAGKVLNYRQLAKLQSTYVTGLGAVVNDDTGRIHSKFNQTVTATGRISSTEPNMQNIPVRTELGRELRKMFTSEKEGWSLCDADYSQIELRVLSHIADDKSMQEAFLNDEDIHTRTASDVFGVPLKDVTSQMRSRAKAVNFGIVYGIGAFSLAQDIGTTRKEAQEYIDGYLSHYKNVAKYMTDTIENAKKLGYITTILNRRRYLPELSSSSHLTRAFGERVAMNAPIQGSAADIIKIAMINVYKKLKSKNLKSKLVLQVHDELIIEGPDEELSAVSEILKEEMENAYTLSVPLKVDMNSGKSWYDT